jgi:hypothetical protein
MSRSFLFIVKQFSKEIKMFCISNEPITNMLQFRLTMVLSTLGVGTHAVYTYSSTKSSTIVIKDKYQFDRNGITEFMLIDETGKHYNINNSLWYWKWNSIEDWHKLEVNSHMRIKYYGYRIPLIGIFPNIFMSNKIE